MPPSDPAHTDSLVPVLRYRDVAAAGHWLRDAFGFELKTLIRSADGSAAQSGEGPAIYAELSHGRGTIMLVPVGQSDLDAHMRQPDELGGIETQTCYVTVSDAALHMKRAVAWGAEIVLPLSGDGSGQNGYSCRDNEGHFWNFGTYAPSSAASDVPVIVAAQRPKLTARGFAFPGITLGLVGLAAWFWAMPDNLLTASAGNLLETKSAATSGSNDGSTRAEVKLEAEIRRSQEVVLKLRQEAAEARSGAKAAEAAAAAASKDLAAEYARRTAAERGGGDLATKAAQLEAELAASKERLSNLESELLKERSARGLSVKATEAARAELEQQIKQREQLEVIVNELDRKADERLLIKQNSESGQKAQSVLPTAAPLAAPAVTGSVSKMDSTAGQATEQKGDKSTPERSKTAAVKKQRSVAPSASRPAARKRAEEKPWPYNSW